MGHPRRRQSIQRDPTTLELQPWAGLRQQWADQPAAAIQAAHQRAAQLVAGGWGAVDWSEG